MLFNGEFRLITFGLSLIVPILCDINFISRASDTNSAPLWIQSHEARVWAGYKDNVLLGYNNTTGSPLVAGGVDLIFFRLPSNGWEYLLMGSAEYVRYLSAREAEQEVMAFAQGQVKKTFLELWVASLSAEYFHFDQVFDTSVFQEQLGTIRLLGHSAILRPSVGTELTPEWRLDLELPVTRQMFDEFVDDYWEVGPKLTLVREYGRKSSISGIYQFQRRLHDTREAREADGQIIPGLPLEFTQHEVSANWRHFWGHDRRWRSVTRLSLLRNVDNGGGHYDYLRPQISEQLRFQAGGWSAIAEGRISRFFYDHQRIADGASAKRERTMFRLVLRGEKSLPRSWKTFAQYEHERALSNLDFDRYAANTVSAGIAREF
jgi:hypothetical protein